MDHPEGNVCPFSTMGPVIWLWQIRGVGHNFQISNWQTEKQKNIIAWSY